MNDVVKSNHNHLIVEDANGLNAIAGSIQFVAGRTGREFNNPNKRNGAFWEDRLPQSVATGSWSFIEGVKKQMHSFAIGRHIRKKSEGFELREPPAPYKVFFNAEKIDIEENLWLWNE